MPKGKTEGKRRDRKYPKKREKILRQGTYRNLKRKALTDVNVSQTAQ